MNKIIFPLKQRMRGQKVTDLQNALQLLLEGGLLLRDDEDAQQELAAALKPELEKHYFGQVTARLVGVFQKEYALPATGEIDEHTAEAIYVAVSNEQENPPEFQYLVRGQVL